MIVLSHAPEKVWTFHLKYLYHVYERNDVEAQQIQFAKFKVWLSRIPHFLTENSNKFTELSIYKTMQKRNQALIYVCFF